MIKEKNEKVKREKVYYIYKIHFLCGFPAGRYYLGKHKGYVDDTYGGSGKFCKAYYKKYGKINGITYIKEILEINPDEETNRLREEIIVGNLWKTDPLCMNQKCGGEGKGWEKGHKISADTREKIANALSNSVDQYDLKGNYIKTWKSVADVSRYFHCSVSAISNCCNEKSNTSHGFIWRWSGDDIPKEIILNIDKFKIACFNLDGTLHKIFNSLKDAVKENKVSISAIEECCTGKLGKANDYMYRHYNDVKDVLKIEPYKSNKKTVLQYDKLGNLIKTYDSLVDAAIAVCGDKNIGKQISACCLGKKKSVYGFVWKYKED